MKSQLNSADLGLGVCAVKSVIQESSTGLSQRVRDRRSVERFGHCVRYWIFTVVVYLDDTAEILTEIRSFARLVDLYSFMVTRCIWAGNGGLQSFVIYESTLIFTMVNKWLLMINFMETVVDRGHHQTPLSALTSSQVRADRRRCGSAVVAPCVVAGAAACPRVLHGDGP